MVFALFCSYLVAKSSQGIQSSEGHRLSVVATGIGHRRVKAGRFESKLKCSQY